MTTVEKLSIREQALNKMLTEMNEAHSGAEDVIHNWLCNQVEEAIFEGIMKDDRSISGAVKYCSSRASKHQAEGVAMIDDKTVFSWVKKYFISEKVKNAIIWSQKNDFWCGVIKSPKSLRKNYDQMATQRNKPVANKPFNKYSKQTKQEILPDWFDKAQKQTKQETSTTESSEDLEKKVAEIKAKLAARSEVQA
ncbi:TPA: Cas9 inhibitor AcrIIA9 family protein [Listeria innocua]|uniref:Cas9 inhibitor AcrIIA9 family protein n=1 Tax=Listeria innocua TaxID=1642 RepID=UPI001BD53760|nr:hypothetical protein [Listeria innocua]